ncbi:transposon Ty3-G Gag-Pol polyprotein [Trichonephila clavipes]|nr:transposon Ty3-G Gag-Pol polyprotein [Trichonephila clavipes]
MEIGTGSSDNGSYAMNRVVLTQYNGDQMSRKMVKRKGQRKKSRREETVTPTTSGYNLRPRSGKRAESRPTIERKTQQGGPVRSRNGRGRNDSPYIEERRRSNSKNARREGDQQRQDQERKGAFTRKSLSLEVLINLLSISLLILSLSLSVGGFNYYNSTKKFLHLIIDHATSYIWAFASKSEITETYASCLRQLFQIQIPIKLLTDRNGAFTSSRFKPFLRNYNVKQLLTTSHLPQTNGKCERVKQSIVTKLRCKVNSSPTKIPWTTLLEQVINEYNLTPHSVTKFPPAYLLFISLPYTSPLAQKQIYPPVEEARKLAKENTMKYHEKNKIKYDARFIDSPFEPGDIVIHEEFNYPNRRKLSPIFQAPTN